MLMPSPYNKLLLLRASLNRCSSAGLRKRLLLLVLCAANACSVAAGQDGRPVRNRPFDVGWQFFRGEAPGAELPAFDDSGWRNLNVPHDWSIEDAPPPARQEPSFQAPVDGWLFGQGDDPSWSAPEFDDSKWKQVTLPFVFESPDGAGGACFGWYRSKVVVPDNLRGKDFVLDLGVVDDADETFFNGKKIGAIGGMPPDFDPSIAPWTQQRSYRVPAALVRDGENVIAVRAYNCTGTGGIKAVRDSFKTVGPFSPESAGGPATGHTLGGTGWYRKRFKLDPGSDGKRTTIVFDGIYMDSDVWLNGHHLGNHPYGYTAFSYDLTPFLKPAGEENILAVRVRNIGRTSRWYSGSGIYRHVELVMTDPLHIAQWGVVVTTPAIAKASATVRVVTAVANAGTAGRKIKVQVRLLGPDGRELKSTAAPAQVEAGGRVEVPVQLDVSSPALWSPESPSLYRAEVSLLDGNKVLDSSSTPFGIRDIAFSVERGFTLNGKTVELRGACLHHDNGPLGAAAYREVEERKVALMKSLGYNAVRTSHNPPSAAFLDACDRLGLLVMDEAFDCWEKGKNPDDYSKYFKAWWQRDLEAMILRDRNHPSVILWSIGNEIPQRADPEGYVIARNLADEVRRLDPTRPVTEGICNFWDQPGRPWSDTAKAFTFLDVGGYNYEPSKYEDDHLKFPKRIMVGTESYPAEIADYWRLVEKHPYVIGDFVWTGMDYLGEAGCGHSRLDNEPGGFGRSWPWFNAFCGDLDLCGFKKPQSFYRDVLWGRSKIEMMVHRPLPPGRKEERSQWGWPDELPGWTWPGAEGKPMQVAVYSSCDSVRLELNGIEVGTKKITPEDKLTARFEVPYAPGELKAVGLNQGKPVAEKVLRTVGDALRIRLVAEPASSSATAQDLVYVGVEITDAEGNLLPDAEIPVQFSVSGSGALAAVGSGSPNRPESYRGPVRTTYRGRALAILQPDGSGGAMKLRADAAGLETGELEIEVCRPRAN